MSIETRQPSEADALRLLFAGTLIGAVALAGFSSARTAYTSFTGQESAVPDPAETAVTTVPEIREIPHWLRDVELTAPEGGRRESRPGEAPYFWRGAPLVLVVRPDPRIGGSIEVRWKDPAGRVVEEQSRRIDRAGADGTLRFEAPDTTGIEPGGYLVVLSWRRPYATGGFSRPPEARLAFGIGERPEMAGPGHDLPAFPWPPPRPTSRHVLRESAIGGGETPEALDRVAERLLAALDMTGYSEHSFYALRPDPAGPPDGFALVTRLEQIRPDGTPRDEPERWSAELPPREIFSLSDVIDALFSAPEGHYRVIVFVVTGALVVPSDEAPTRHDAGEWLGSGMARLPRALGELPWTADHACTALVYQFRQVGAGTDPQAHPPGAPSAQKHLERTGLLRALER